MAGDAYPIPYWPVYICPCHIHSWMNWPSIAPIIPLQYNLQKFINPADIETVFKNNKKLWGSFEKLKQNKTSFR